LEKLSAATVLDEIYGIMADKGKEQGVEISKGSRSEVAISKATQSPSHAAG